VELVDITYWLSCERWLSGIIRPHSGPYTSNRLQTCATVRIGANMQNIEFKCELLDIGAAQVQCQMLGAECVGRLEQTDTYFKLPDGRLKRREVPGDPVEWIFYHRPDRVTPKMSHFMIYSEEQARARWGVLPLKEWVTVRKVREVFLLENLRIHLDDVDELGWFIEFEAQVSPKYNVRVCHVQIAKMRRQFGPILGEAIAAGYADLMDRFQRVADV